MFINVRHTSPKCSYIISYSTGFWPMYLRVIDMFIFVFLNVYSWSDGKGKINKRKEIWEISSLIHYSLNQTNWLSNGFFFGESTGVVTSPLLLKGWRTWRTLHRTLEQRKVQPYRHIISFELTWWDLVCHIVNFVLHPSSIWLKYCRYCVKHYSINQSIYQLLTQSINQSINQPIQ